MSHIHGTKPMISCARYDGWPVMKKVKVKNVFQTTLEAFTQSENEIKQFILKPSETETSEEYLSVKI